MDGLEDYDETVVSMIDEDKFSIGKAIKINVIFLSIAAILGVCSNVYVVWLLNTTKCRCVTNLYIINRSLADLLFLLTVPTIVTQLVEQKWLFGTFMCKTMMATTHACGLASAFSLAALSCNSYFAETGIFNNNGLLKWFKIFAFGIWISALIYAIPHLVLFGILNFGTDSHCTLLSMSGSVMTLLYITNIAIIAIPMVISGLMVTVVFLISGWTANPNLNDENRSAKKLLLALTIAFVIGELPFVLTRLVHVVIPFPGEAMIKAMYLTMPLPFIVAALNPLIYIAFKGDLLKTQPSEVVLCHEPTVALLSSEHDAVFFQ